MIKVISLMSYCTLLYIIALVDCAESSRWSFVSLGSVILVALGDWSLAKAINKKHLHQTNLNIE